MEVSKKLQVDLSHDLAVQLLDIYTQKDSIAYYRDTSASCSLLFYSQYLGGGVGPDLPGGWGETGDLLLFISFIYFLCVHVSVHTCMCVFTNMYTGHVWRPENNVHD